jgi:hypothetical protein
MGPTPRTNHEMFFVMKYFLPLVLFGASGALLASGHPSFSVWASRIPLQIPFVLWGIFLLTLAEIHLTENYLEYRRFFKWQRIPYSEIRQARDSLHPGLGWITLNRFVFPWSRMYFVTLWPVFDRRLDLVAHIEDRCSANHRPDALSPINTHQNMRGGDRKAVLLCLIMGFVGVVYSILLTAWFPNFFSESNWDGYPPWLAPMMKILLRASSWP